MPFLRFSRDKRGYEHFSIVEPSVGRRGKSSRPRVLFWFRTPPQVKVGREPFTDDIRRAIENQNPGLKFDWPRLMATPIPAADAEHWRERRRAEKAARQAMREEGQDGQVGRDGQDGQDGQDGRDGQDGQVGRDGQVGQAEKESDEDRGVAGDEENGDEHPIGDNAQLPAETVLSASESQGAVPVSGGAPPAGARRRRRRGRRRRPQTAESSPGTAVPASGPVGPNGPVPPTEEV